MLYANDNDGNRVHIQDVQQGESYYCPLCGQQLILKLGTKKIHHFAHKSLKDCDTWAEGMSNWHLEWQERLTKSFHSKDLAEVVLEVDGKKHRADFMVNSLVIEFQHSPMSQTEYDERCEFYTTNNKKLIWVFDYREKYANKRIMSTKYYNHKYKKLIKAYKWLYPCKLDYIHENVEVFFQLTNTLIVRYKCICNRRSKYYYFKADKFTSDSFVRYMYILAKKEQERAI